MAEADAERRADGQQRLARGQLELVEVVGLHLRVAHEVARVARVELRHEAARREHLPRAAPYAPAAPSAALTTSRRRCARRALTTTRPMGARPCCRDAKVRQRLCAAAASSVDSVE